MGVLSIKYKVYYINRDFDMAHVSIITQDFTTLLSIIQTDPSIRLNDVVGIFNQDLHEATLGGGEKDA